MGKCSTWLNIQGKPWLSPIHQAVSLLQMPLVYNTWNTTKAGRTSLNNGGLIHTWIITFCVVTVGCINANLSHQVTRRAGGGRSCQSTWIQNHASPCLPRQGLLAATSICNCCWLPLCKFGDYSKSEIIAQFPRSFFCTKARNIQLMKPESSLNQNLFTSMPLPTISGQWSKLVKERSLVIFHKTHHKSGRF